jgi:hypothetical protein
MELLSNPSISLAYRSKLTQNILDELQSPAFREAAKKDPKIPHRDRKLPLLKLICMILTFKSAIQRELDAFFKQVSGSEFNIRQVTKSAFSQARAKLNPGAFQRLNQIATDTFYAQANAHTWQGFRLLAVDGSRLALPNHVSVVEHFGQHQFGPNADSPKSLALASVLYDVLNLLPLDGQLDRYDSDERSLLLNHLDRLQKGDLLLLDRGYGCFWLLFLLYARRIEFCVRLKADWWLSVNEFTQSDEQERLVWFDLPKKDRDKLAGYPLYQDRRIQCRLIKVVLPTGETEILCTSLLDSNRYPQAVFGPLYHCRWQEEEAYKLFKCRVEIENFSGKTALAVQQDFFAKLFLMTLCAAYAHPIEARVREEYQADEQRDFAQKINRTHALSMTQQMLLSIFIKRQFKRAIAAFDHLVFHTRELIRPGRKVPRKHKPKRQYHMAYKRL